VIVKDNNGCIRNDTVVIASSAPINLQLSHTDVSCADELTGSANAIVTGGTPPYSFQWINNTQIFNGNPITHIGAGTYNLELQDSVGCTVTASVIITQPEALKIAIATKSSYCDLNNGSASATVSGGTFPYGFLWTPVRNTTSTLNNVGAGSYALTVVDQNNCTTSIVATILNDKPKPVFLGNDTTLCPGDKIVLSPGPYIYYRWQDNSVSPNYVVTSPGIYTVEVTDGLACTLKGSIKIIGDCGFIFFPTAITPNNDMRNDLFGPLGVLSTVKDYTLLVYTRQGQLVFKSTDPFKKWDGKMQNNRTLPGTYVWIATYSNKGKTNILQKGTVTVIY
jgi:gliding motility-associated-like protein